MIHFFRYRDIRLRVLERIRLQVETIKEYIDELKGEKSYRGIERLVYLSIQALLDLGLMILSAIDVEAEGYRCVGTSLSSSGFLDEEEGHLLRSMAGLRNILVHGYSKINRDLVLKASKRLPKDVMKIASKLEKASGVRIKDPKEESSSLVSSLKKILEGRVEAAFLFGSRAKGYKLRGDFDVAVYFGQEPDCYAVGELLADLQDALGTDDVDLLVLDYCDDLELAYRAVRGIPIVGEDDVIVWLRAKTASQLFDYQIAMKKASTSHILGKS